MKTLSTKLGACSGGRGRASRRRSAAAFTLLELLVVIAIIAILTSLLLPSLQGLMGVAGRRGGASVLSAALEQARLSALENGGAAYVGFAISSTNPDNKYSSLIVFRAKRDDETGAAYVPLSRWVRLPTGVQMDPQSISSAAKASISVSSGVLPRLGSEQVSSLQAIEFDRFGRLKGHAQPPVLKVGEGIVSDSAVQFRQGANALYAVTILPLTGRVQISETSSP